jgi:hypothetical protein
MQKPNSYDEVQVGEFTPIELGGHHAIIKDVKEQKSQTGKDMIVVAIDFAKNDKQANYFMDSFEKDIRPDKKWPYQAVQYIVAEGNDGKTTRNFKSFITAYEKSNNCENQTVWGEAFCKQFKGKKIGVVYGNVEEEYNGERKMRRRIRWFCEDAAVDTAKVPDDKLLGAGTTVRSTDNSFVNIPAGVDEEIPF